MADQDAVVATLLDRLGETYAAEAGITLAASRRRCTSCRVAKGADLIGLPTDPAGLAALVPPTDLPRLVAALVRVSLHPAATKDIELRSDGE